MENISELIKAIYFCTVLFGFYGVSIQWSDYIFSLQLCEVVSEDINSHLIAGEL